jgi:hypothetical protein
MMPPSDLRYGLEVSRADLDQALKMAGTRHSFMIYHSHRLAIPSNTEYSVDEVRMMMAEVEAILGRSVTEVALPLVAIRG